MELRLLPIVIFATSAVLGLKIVDLLALRLDNVQWTSPALASTPAPAAPPAAPAAGAPANRNAAPVISVPEARTSADQLNERLGDRRRQLDERDRELDMRENLLRATEARLEQRVEELRRLEQRAATANTQVDEQRNQQMRGLVVMYESMKPRDAGRIFDRLDMDILLEVVTRMRPAKVADILAEMQPDPAKRLTTELARRSLGQPSGSSLPQTNGSTRELPRIEPAAAQPRPGASSGR